MNHRSFKRKWEKHPSPEMKLRGLVPKFDIHVYVSDLYIPSIGLQTKYSKIADRLWEYINYSQIHECIYWERGRAVSFLGIFVSNYFRYSVDGTWRILACGDIYDRCVGEEGQGNVY